MDFRFTLLFVVILNIIAIGYLDHRMTTLEHGMDAAIASVVTK